MTKRPGIQYWPLGRLGHADEIREHFSEEAALIGTLTILWNNHEIDLSRLFTYLVGGKHSYAYAIWARQPTHKARRDLLELALEHGDLDEPRRVQLAEIIKGTKAIADQRNDLIHAEYVVHSRTDRLHAKVRAPNSAKPPTYHGSSVKDLQRIIDELGRLNGITSQLIVDLYDRDGSMRQSIAAVAATLRGKGSWPSQGNPRSGSPPPSDPQES
ncbi:MAG: hypothetical protein V7672_03830 [Brevundimonas sp.]|uniref:hypothetical protein n=1 Tax=Brevundimonas sp. TaxID=1871086 RepID=UPI0030014757